jgi:DNA adenine methylase
MFMAKPFLKWAGGKRQLLTQIMDRIPSESEECKKYIEPFVGAGAVLFHLLERSEEFEFTEYHIIDINVELILSYKALKQDATLVYSELKELIDNYPNTQEERIKKSLAVIMMLEVCGIKI